MFRNGSSSDPKGKEGLTYAAATLVTSGGTKDLSYQQIKEVIYPMAASYNSAVEKEVSVFTFAVPKDFLEKFYLIVGNLILAPSFTENDFKRVKSNQLNNVEQLIKASSDEEYSKKALEDLLFRGSSYQHMIQGTLQGVNAITLEDIKTHYKHVFTKANLTIGIAGDYTPAFLERVKKDKATLPTNRPTLPKAVPVKAAQGIQVEIISKADALGSAIFTGAPLAITRSHDDFAALMVANLFLGEHRLPYGKLVFQIRNLRSINYGDFSYIEWYESGGSNMLPLPGVPRSSNYFSLWIRPVQLAQGLQKQYTELKDIQVGHTHLRYVWQYEK